MDDSRTRALLVDFDPARAGAGVVGTVLTRGEIADTAARGEYPATLLLDLDRTELEDGQEVTAHATIAVDWDEDTLDRLLASTEADEIALWFDESELARAFDDDVEGHGLREKAAVLVVAAAAAAASATPAFARFAAEPDGGGGGGSAAAINVNPAATHEGAVVQPMGAERGVQMDEQIAVSHAQGATAGDSAATSSGGPSSGEIAAIAGLGAVLVSAAGFGVARKRTPPAQPA
jgi:hypothetical protein